MHPKLATVKPILNTTLWCLHDASRSFKETLGTSVARTNTLRQYFFGVRRNVQKHLQCFWWASLDFTQRWHQVTEQANWPWHSATCHFYLPSPLPSFNVRCECKVYLSACWRYTINCGIPPIQNTQIDHAEEARCTLFISCLTDLDFCVVFVNQAGGCISWKCLEL